MHVLTTVRGNLFAPKYFRDLVLPDIDALFEISPSNSLATRKNCFMILYVEMNPGRI